MNHYKKFISAWNIEIKKGFVSLGPNTAKLLVNALRLSVEELSEIHKAKLWSCEETFKKIDDLFNC